MCHSTVSLVRLCSIEKPTQFTWKLRIKSIQLTEQGNYTCFVYTTRQNKKEANMTVTVLGEFLSVNAHRAGEDHEVRFWWRVILGARVDLERLG